ncbi:MAG: LysR substrate-binding domain-containing protein [Gammaproteobacteria bacterium]
MTLTELRYIVAVARHGNFGRAAQACFVSQPTLSVAVRKLEDELELTLFERRKSAVSLTPAGKAIVEQAERVLAEAQTLKQLAAGEHDQLHGVLRVGLIHTVGPYILPELVPELTERAPDMPLVVEEDMTANLRRRLDAGGLDVIVIALPFDEPGVLTRALYDEPFVVLLPAAHAWTQRETIAVGELSQENLLLLGPGHCFRDQVLSVCPECINDNPSGQPSALSLENSSLETIRHMVVSGLGITVAPCTAAGAERYARRLLAVRRFSPPEPKRTVAMAWRKTFTRPQALECFAGAVLTCALAGVVKHALPH